MSGRAAVAASATEKAYRHGSANFLWVYGFVFDAIAIATATSQQPAASSQQIKCLTVIDEFPRECLAIDGAGPIRSTRVIEVLSRLVSMHRAPLFLRSDNGP